MIMYASLFLRLVITTAQLGWQRLQAETTQHAESQKPGGQQLMVVHPNLFQHRNITNIDLFLSVVSVMHFLSALLSDCLKRFTSNFRPKFKSQNLSCRLRQLPHRSENCFPLTSPFLAPTVRIVCKVTIGSLRVNTTTLIMTMPMFFKVSSITLISLGKMRVMTKKKCNLNPIYKIIQFQESCLQFEDQINIAFSVSHFNQLLWNPGRTNRTYFAYSYQEDQDVSPRYLGNGSI